MYLAKEKEERSLLHYTHKKLLIGTIMFFVLYNLSENILMVIGFFNFKGDLVYEDLRILLSPLA